MGKDNGITFLETSAKTGDSIVSIFEKIGHQVLSEEVSQEQSKGNEGGTNGVVSVVDKVHLDKPLDFAGTPEQKADGTPAVPKKPKCCA